MCTARSVALPQAFEHEELAAEVGPMSTRVSGDSGSGFTALREGVEPAARPQRDHRGRPRPHGVVHDECPAPRVRGDASVEAMEMLLAEMGKTRVDGEFLMTIGG